MRYRRIEFLTRNGCGLCDETLPQLSRYARWFTVELVVTDISSDPDLEAEYHLRVPVILDRRSRVLAEGQITRGQMRRACWSAFF